MPTSNPRPFTHAQALQNAAFLKALARTGNAREAARELGVHRATFTKRRAKHAAFAAEWDATLALVHARLNDPRCRPSQSPSRLREGLGEGERDGRSHRRGRATTPEPALVRTANGRLQLRRPAQRRLTREAEEYGKKATPERPLVRVCAHGN